MNFIWIIQKFCITLQKFLTGNASKIRKFIHFIKIYNGE
jgi:hypothetical protein